MRPNAREHPPSQKSCGIIDPHLVGKRRHCKRYREKGNGADAMNTADQE